MFKVGHTLLRSKEDALISTVRPHAYTRTTSGTLGQMVWAALPKAVVSGFAFEVLKRWVFLGRVYLLGICFYERDWGQTGKALHCQKVMLAFYPFCV